MHTQQKKKRNLRGSFNLSCSGWGRWILCTNRGGGGAESCAQTAEEIKNYWNACLRGKGNKFVVILTAPFCRPLPMSNDVEMTSYWRWCDVATSQQRQYDLCACWAVNHNRSQPFFLFQILASSQVLMSEYLHLQKNRILSDICIVFNAEKSWLQVMGIM